MTTPTSSDIERMLGEVDDLTVDQILATGASLEDIEEAIFEVDDERSLGTSRPPSNDIVAAVRAIVEDVFDRNEFQDDDPTREKEISSWL